MNILWAPIVCQSLCRAHWGHEDERRLPTGHCISSSTTRQLNSPYLCCQHMASQSQSPRMALSLVTLASHLRKRSNHTTLSVQQGGLATNHRASVAQTCQPTPEPQSLSSGPPAQPLRQDSQPLQRLSVTSLTLCPPASGAVPSRHSYTWGPAHRANKATSSG